jgi:hypothetical protein
MGGQIIVVSDTHVGCQFALCPEFCTLAAGGTYRRSSIQTWIYEQWHDFWHVWVPEVTKGEPYGVVFNGDSIDARHHGAITKWTQDHVDMAAACIDLLRPICDRAAAVYFVAGTEAHAGQAFEHERNIASALGAVPDAAGNPVHQILRLDLDGWLVDCQHHIGTTSSMAYESTALCRELTEAFADAGRNGLRAPHVLIRSHRHRPFRLESPSSRGDATIATTAGWQLRTPFVGRVMGGRVQSPIVGGLLVRTGNDDIYVRSRNYVLPEAEPIAF